MYRASRVRAVCPMYGVLEPGKSRGTNVHRRWGIAVLVASLALAGCARPVAASYESALTQEATPAAGIAEATLTPAAFKVAKKTDTVIAVRASSQNGVSSGSSAVVSKGDYSARVIASSCADSVTLILLVMSRTGKSVAGAKATVTLNIMAGSSGQSGTYTLTADAHGRAQMTVKAPPAQYQTGMSISGVVTVGGVRVPTNFIGYSTGNR